MKKIVFTILLIFASVTAAYAVIAYNQPIKVTQPDGTVITIRLHGDEFLNWATCGNSLVAKGSDGYWRYATFNVDGVSQAQGARVQSTMAGDGSNVTPPPAAVEKARQKRAAMNNKHSVKKAPSVSKVDGPPLSTGEKHFLILLIQFSDKSFSESIDGYPGGYDAKNHFENLLNGTNFTYNDAAGSVNKYYQDVSFNKFNPVFDVYGPVTVSNNSAYYADLDNTYNAVKEACEELDSQIDFTKYCNENQSLVDNIFFFFPGYNAAEGGGDETIWPHACTFPEPFLTLDGVGIYHYGCASEFRGAEGQKLAGIGTFCHEFGHVIGLPDFYDIDYEDFGQGIALEFLSLMASGNYNNEGRTPPYLTYEEKHILGWDGGLIPLSAGNNTLEKTSQNKSYFNPTSNEGEYYLYESRPCEGWDKYTLSPGMAIYHVDKSQNILPDGATAADHWNWGNINNIASHQCMDLVETVVPESRVQYYEQMTFPGCDNVTAFTENTTPGAISWSGAPTGYNLSDISFDKTTGKTTFTVEQQIKVVGTVMNTSHQPISGAEIVVKYNPSPGGEVSPVNIGNGLYMIRLNSQQNGTEYKVTSDSNGHYEVSLSDVGHYSVSATKEGYSPFYAEVDVNAVSEVDIVLCVPAETVERKELKKFTEISDRIAGYGSGVDHFAGLKYESSELTEYVGYPIQSIAFMAYNNGNGTVDKMGVKVYFDDELKCDCECTPIFNTMNIVDISSYGLHIPEGKSVTFVYYLINPSYGYPFILADIDNPVEGANLINNYDGLDWNKLNANVVIFATLVEGLEVINRAGINYITLQYDSSTDQYEPIVSPHDSKGITAVYWIVNGERKNDKFTLGPGEYTVRAEVSYNTGRNEFIETKIKIGE